MFRYIDIEIYSYVSDLFRDERDPRRDVCWGRLGKTNSWLSQVAEPGGAAVLGSPNVRIDAFCMFFL